jgi:ribonuclease HI
MLLTVLAKVELNQLWLELSQLLISFRIVKMTWIFCPSHAGVKGNERVDRLANAAKVGTRRFQLGSNEMLDQLINQNRERLDSN